MKARQITHNVAILSLALFSVSVSAALQVIADVGGESAVRFYEPIQPVHSENAPRHENAVPSDVSEAQMLPVISHKWSVGKVAARPFDLAGAMPMFLVGADTVSQQWLAKNREKLTALAATGLIINVQTVEELNHLRSIVPDLVLMPVSADSLADRLGIYHYPLLMTAEGISQ